MQNASPFAPLIGANTPLSDRQPLIGMIWAADHQRIIGDGAAMPWHVPEDMKFFAAATRGCPVLMGRATWDSLSPSYRPLPGRPNVVMSRSVSEIAGAAATVSSLDDGLRTLRTLALERRQGGHDGMQKLEQLPAPLPVEAWVLGGGTVYEQAAGHQDVSVAVITDLDVDASGRVSDPVTAPELAGWTALHCGPWLVSESAKVGIGQDLTPLPVRYRFRVMARPKLAIP